MLLACFVKVREPRDVFLSGPCAERLCCIRPLTAIPHAWWPVFWVLLHSLSHFLCSHNVQKFGQTFSFTCWAASPSLSPAHSKPSQLCLCRVAVEARSCDAALHHSPSRSNSSYRAWRCVWVPCPAEKQMMAPLNQVWMACCCRMDVVAMLVSPLTHRHTSSSCMLPSGNHTMSAHFFCSWKEQRLHIWTHQTTDFHCSNVHSL